MRKMSLYFLVMVLSIVLVTVFSLSGCKAEAPSESLEQTEKAVEETVVETEKVAEEIQETEQDTGGELSNLEKSLTVDVSGLTTASGQPLVQLITPPLPPERPTDEEMSRLTEQDALYWYDKEYLGVETEKINIPESPADGAFGKRIIFIGAGDHPFFVAQEAGARQVAEAYGITYDRWQAEWNIDIQTQMVDQAINERPDMIIIQVADQSAGVSLVRKINQAGIPVMGSSSMLDPEGYNYLISWCGPYDWLAWRNLANEFAELMNYEGGWCNIRHNPGTSFYDSRSWSAITEINNIAPDMELLDYVTTNMEAELTTQVVSDWITKYGDKLKGIMAADDNAVFIGIEEALRAAQRDDIIITGAGNSKVGMEALQKGLAHAITFEDPEIGGAIAVKLAADWFCGKEIEPYYILPTDIITQDNVEEYMPASW